MRYDKTATRDGKALRFLPTFSFTTSAGVLAAMMLGAVSLVLPPLPSEPEGPTSSRRPSRIQRHTGAGGRGMHRAWKHQRASGRS